MMTVKTKALSALAAALVAVLAGCGTGSDKAADTPAPSTAPSDPTGAAPGASTPATGGPESTGESCLTGTWIPTKKADGDIVEKSQTYSADGSFIQETEGTAKAGELSIEGRWKITPEGGIMVFSNFFYVDGEQVSGQDLTYDLDYSHLSLNDKHFEYTCSGDTLTLENETEALTYTRQ